MELVILSVGLISFIVQIGLAVAIFADASTIGTHRLPLGIGPWLWAWATLVAGIIAVGIYWLIYHSSLRREPVGPDGRV